MQGTTYHNIVTGTDNVHQEDDVKVNPRGADETRLGSSGTSHVVSSGSSIKGSPNIDAMVSPATSPRMSTLTSSINTYGNNLPQMPNVAPVVSGGSSEKAPLDLGYGVEEGPATGVHAVNSIYTSNDSSIDIERDFERHGSGPSVIEKPPNNDSEEDSSDDDLDAYDTAPRVRKQLNAMRWGSKSFFDDSEVYHRDDSEAFHCDIVNTLSQQQQQPSRRQVFGGKSSLRGGQLFRKREKRVAKKISIVDETAGGGYGSFIWLPLLISLAMLFLECLCLPAYYLFHDESRSILRETDFTIKFQYFATCLAIIPISIFMLWAIKQIAPAGGLGGETTEDGAAGTTNVILRDSGILLVLCLALHQATNVVKETVREEFQSSLLRSLETGLGFSMFSFFVSIIDLFINCIAKMADRLESIATSNPTSKQWKGFMKGMARFRDPEKPILDQAYAIPGGTRSPARVLLEVAGVYGNLAKIFGFIFLFLFMVGVDLYSNLVIFGTTALYAAILRALNINEALSNLIPLALSNSVHIGEIVAIARTGLMPPNTPSEALVGFVEAVTWSHVVIRDFKRNQVFVPHHKMEDQTLWNWSRRPSKLIRFELAVVPSLSGGADRLAILSKFVLDWIAKHPKIDQSLYNKCAIKFRNASAQPFLEVIFYPLVGQKSRVVRAEFTVMIMDACKRLDICLLPTEVRTGTAWPVESKNEVQDIANAARLQEEEGDELVPDLSDLMPSEALTKRSGLPPSKKKKD